VKPKWEYKSLADAASQKLAMPTTMPLRPTYFRQKPEYAASIATVLPLSD
jgi:hypothetical protein